MFYRWFFKSGEVKFWRKDGRFLQSVVKFWISVVEVLQKGRLIVSVYIDKIVLPIDKR